MFTLPKRFIALTLFAALAAMPVCVLHAQWQQCDGPYSGNTTCFVATDAYICAATENDGIVRSTDGGLTWKRTNGSGANLLMASDGIILGLSQNGTFGNYLSGSTDGGLTWPGFSYPFLHGSDTLSLSSANITPLAIFVVEADRKNGEVLLYRSTDSGTTWLAADSSVLSGPVFAVRDLVIARRFNGVWMRSTDQGSSWDTISWSNMTVTNIAENNSGIFVCTNQGVLASTDSGLTWQPRNNGLTSFNISQLAVTNDTLLVGTMDLGAFVSTNDGVSWLTMNAGLPTRSVQNVAISNATFLVSAKAHSQYGGLILFGAAAVGASWEPLNCRWGRMSIYALTENKGEILAGTELGFYSSTDSGWSWYPVRSWNSDPLVDSLIPLDLGIGSLGSHDGVLYMGTNIAEICRSTNGGVSWELCLFPRSDDPVSFNFAFLNDLVFANPAGGQLWMSNDSGKSWKKIEQFVPLLYELGVYGNSPVYCFDTLGGALLFGTNSDTGFFISSDDGMTWSSWGNAPGIRITAMAVTNGGIFVATAYDEFTGFYFSSDNGNQWTSVNDDGYGGSGVTLLSSFGYLISDGYRRPLSEMIPPPSAVAEEPPVSDAFQTYPNPFTQSTQISFTSASAGYADISIVNLLGAEVARVFSGELDAGSHNFTFANPTGLPDGIYECLLRMNGRIETLPMALIH